MGGFCAKRLTFVSIETGYFTGLCNWIRWIRPFLDNGAVQLGGHWRALTPCWSVLRWPVQHFHSFCVRVCVFLCVKVIAASKALGIQLGSLSPLLHLPLSDISSSSCLIPTPPKTCTPVRLCALSSLRSPASPFISAHHYAQQQSWYISKHFIQMSDER